MMLGTPCISFNVGDAALIIGNCGYILPNKSFQSVCLKLHEAALSANTSEYRDMREAARLRFKSLFTLEEMACSYNLIYSSNVLTLLSLVRKCKLVLSYLQLSWCYALSPSDSVPFLLLI